MDGAVDGTWTSIHGVAIPRILYGTAWKKDRTAGLVELALATGFRGIDTACQPKHYDEAGVGAGLAAALAKGLRREDLYLQTKFTPLAGQDPQRLPYDPQAPLARQVAQSFERSRANLGVETLDGLVLHSPLPNPSDFREVWGAMEALVDGGGVRQLGISNCYDPEVLRHLCETSRIKPAVVQNRFYAATGFDRVLRLYCRRNGIFYQSFWTLTANPDILAHDVTRSLMARHGRSAAQIFFRYLSQQEIIPLTGTSSAVHMREDLEIADFALSAEECQALEALLGGGP
ncbi:aldo/keto reductase family protein [Paramagnetospirillum magneticum]|uniref:Aldo/keto reductase n=1 Tax=Paramagnetospirillum magneticum (strain ATCC 700264 / AMB-1) TaxID=342108 RepID=Q2W4G5_PARM1|nr:aldo/keto reductase [Paramagnetospirillum magneticum]BAE51260.1 Aldo/keto reductase [Paramagnetospirillum magneticum AMB-1]